VERVRIVGSDGVILARDVEQLAFASRNVVGWMR
jgi:hypothetical protein